MVDCPPPGRSVVRTTTWLMSPACPAGGVYLVVIVLPCASVVVISWPAFVPDSTTWLPYLSVVVYREAPPFPPLPPFPLPTMLPPGATVTPARGVVVVTVCPWALVVVLIVAGTVVEVVICCPFAFVVVTTVATVVWAFDWNAEVVFTTVLPLLSVDEIVTGTRTPVWVLGEGVLLLAPLPPPPPPPPFFVVVAPPPLPFEELGVLPMNEELALFDMIKSEARTRVQRRH